jgi:FAD/FMN-containing dehydrogenase
LKQLFIGSEGTIGIITAISILCPRRSQSTNVAVFSLPSYEAVLKVFGETKKHLGEILSAFEFFDKASYELVKHHQREHGVEVKKVFDNEGDFYVLVETSGSNSDHDEEVGSAAVASADPIALLAGRTNPRVVAHEVLTVETFRSDRASDGGGARDGRCVGAGRDADRLVMGFAGRHHRGVQQDWRGVQVRLVDRP